MTPPHRHPDRAARQLVQFRGAALTRVHAADGAPHAPLPRPAAVLSCRAGLVPPRVTSSGVVLLRNISLVNNCVRDVQRVVGLTRSVQNLLGAFSLTLVTRSVEFLGAAVYMRRREVLFQMYIMQLMQLQTSNAWGEGGWVGAPLGGRAGQPPKSCLTGFHQARQHTKGADECRKRRRRANLQALGVLEEGMLCGGGGRGRQVGWRTACRAWADPCPLSTPLAVRARCQRQLDSFTNFNPVIRRSSAHMFLMASANASGWSGADVAFTVSPSGAPPPRARCWY